MRHSRPNLVETTLWVWLRLTMLYPGTDQVEFSTPQLYPSGTPDDHAWLNNLSTIPGMNDNNNNNHNNNNNNSSSTNGTHVNGAHDGARQ